MCPKIYITLIDEEIINGNVFFQNAHKSSGSNDTSHSESSTLTASATRTSNRSENENESEREESGRENGNGNIRNETTMAHVHDTGNGSVTGNEPRQGLNLKMSAKELRAQLAARKKYDPKKESIGFKDKFDIVQKL